MTGLGYLFLAGVIFLAGCGTLLYFFTKWFMKGPKCYSKVSLAGKTVIITGGTSGVGKETAFELSLRGARIVLVCRDVAKGQEVAGAIKGDTQGEIQVEQCDLASLTSVRQFAAKMLETESRVDILVNCAGVRNTPQWKTQDGFEYQLGVNYLAHFLLTWLLLPVIKRASPGARIINVSCRQHKKAMFDPDNLFSEPIKYKKRFAYARSKLCILMFSTELARRLEGTGVNVYTANPGSSSTSLGRYTRQSSGILMAGLLSIFYWPWLRSPNNAAQTLLHCALEESLEDQTGLYYEDCSIAVPSFDAENVGDALELWKLTERAVGLS